METVRFRWRWRRVMACVAAGTILWAACGGADEPAATVDGTEIAVSDVDALHTPDAEVTAEERASTMFLLVLHRLLTTAADDDFGLTLDDDARTNALKDRMAGLDEEELADRGITADRVALEADLDVVRAELQERMVHEPGWGFVFEDAYRDFLGANSRVCIVMSEPLGDDLVDTVAGEAEAGDDAAAIAAGHPEVTLLPDLGCMAPIDLQGEPAAVAVDGEVDRAYVVAGPDGAPILVEVTERDAPAAEDVRDEVILLGIETQGPALFDAWAVDIVNGADVVIDDDIGTWAPASGTGDLPTVVPSDQ